MQLSELHLGNPYLAIALITFHLQYSFHLGIQIKFLPSFSFKTQTCGGRSQPPIHLLQFAIHKNCKTTCPKVENEISNIVHVQCILHLLKARTTMDIFLPHSYILVFLPKSLFSITLILICITLSLVTLLGNHFSFHFIALHCNRNVILSVRKKSKVSSLLCQAFIQNPHPHLYKKTLILWNNGLSPVINILFSLFPVKTITHFSLQCLEVGDQKQILDWHCFSKKDTFSNLSCIL